MGYRIINGRAYPVGNFPEYKDTAVKKNNIDEETFKDVLKKELYKTNSSQGFNLSKHAAERLDSLNFTKDDYKEIERGLGKAREKGSKNTLMFYKDVAIIASVQNNTVITAVDKERSKENVFTNVDSVVIL